MKKFLLITLAVVVAVVALYYLYNFYTELKLKELKEEIYSVRSLSAADLSQCKSIPLGSKACGGPKTHIIYSIGTTDEDLLIELADRYTSIEEGLNTRKGVMSDCSYVMEPELDFINGQCRQSALQEIF